MGQKTLFRKVAERMRCDERWAESLTFAVFQELRDRLTPGEAADVDAQLAGRTQDAYLQKDDRAADLQNEDAGGGTLTATQDFKMEIAVEIKHCKVSLETRHYMAGSRQYSVVRRFLWHC